MDQAKAAFDAARAAEEAAGKEIAQAQERLELARTTILAVELRRKQVEQAKERLKEARAAVGVAAAREGIGDPATFVTLRAAGSPLREMLSPIR